jgi:hypothetical protein
MDMIYMNHHFATDYWKMVLLKHAQFTSPYYIENILKLRNFDVTAN